MEAKTKSLVFTDVKPGFFRSPISIIRRIEMERLVCSVFVKSNRFNSKMITCLFFLILVAIIGTTGVLAQPPDTPNPDTWVTDNNVNAIAHANGITYIGGGFTYVGPNTGHSAALSVTTGKPLPPYARVDGNIWTAVSDGAGGWYIGGEFWQVCGVTRNNIAHILSDGTLDASWNPNANSGVAALAVSGSVIYAGGWFTSIGGQTRNYIAALDATTGLATS